MQLLAKFKIILYMRFFKLYVNFFEFGIVSRFNLYAIAGIISIISLLTADRFSVLMSRTRVNNKRLLCKTFACTSSF